MQLQYDQSQRKADMLQHTQLMLKQQTMEQNNEREHSLAHHHPLGNVWVHLAQRSFRDALCLRFVRTPARLAPHCPCGQPFNVSHAFSCLKGAFPSICHNVIRDVTAQLLAEVCPNVGVESVLRPLSGKIFHLPVPVSRTLLD